jgi:phosphoribosyl 1,2-cyclic phosphodiesterase
MRDDSSSIKILGAYGGKSTNMALTSIQLSKKVVLDAGNILEGLGNGSKNINHLFITHSHLDHINDIGFLKKNIKCNNRCFISIKDGTTSI